MTAAGRRAGRAAALAALGTLALAAPAIASTVYADREGAFGYTAASGEANDLLIERRSPPLNIRVTDPGAVIIPTGTCATAGASEAHCHFPRPDCSFLGCETSAVLELGDRNDRIRGLPAGFVNLLNVYGGSGDDVLRSSAAATTYQFGQGGNDTLHAGGYGGTGNDLIYGDGFGEAGNDRLIGNEFDNQFIGGAGADYMKGNAGADTISYADKVNPVQVTLDAIANDGTAGEGDNANAENILGGAGSDVLNGNEWANLLRGGAGRDTLRTYAGNDQILAEDGEADVVNCGLGDDTAAVDAGLDQVFGCERIT